MSTTRRSGRLGNLEAQAHYAGNLLRLAWYTGVGSLADQAARRAGDVRLPRPAGRVVPDRDTVLADIVDLMRRDADLVRRGAAAAGNDPASGVADHALRLWAMLSDIPSTVARQ